jgi:GT2 family glycosyltransferase
MKVGFVCTNYMSARFTLAAVRSLLLNLEAKVFVAIVDNNSGGHDLLTLSSLCDEFPNSVEVVESKENLGYFRGLNVGIKRLRELHGRFDAVVVGNNDLIFPSDFIRSIRLRRSLLAQYPVISPNIETLDGAHQNPHVIESIAKPRELLYDLYYSNFQIARLLLWIARMTRPLSSRKDESKWQMSGPIYQGHGSCYILSELFFEKFEHLWAPTFLMGEEYFLSKQIHDRGFKIYYESNIRVTHCYHASVSRIPGRKLWEHSRSAHRLYRMYVK